MRFVGHTMATPGEPVYDSIDLFRSLGLEGIEILCRPGTDLAPDVDDARAVRMADYAGYNGLPVVALTPYAWDINAAEPSTAAAAAGLLRRAVDLADLMRAGVVRAHSGRPCPADPSGAWDRAVAALRQAGAYAARRGVTLVVENHPGTLTPCGASTRRLVDAVGLDSVRILYDPANILAHTDEAWETGLEIQADRVAHVHAKDFDWHDGRRRARPLGAGVVPWPAILAGLRRHGYDGTVSFEYERLWYPDDLPAARTGLAESMAFARQALTGATPAPRRTA